MDELLLIVKSCGKWYYLPIRCPRRSISNASPFHEGSLVSKGSSPYFERFEQLQHLRRWAEGQNCEVSSPTMSTVSSFQKQGHKPMKIIMSVPRMKLPEGEVQPVPFHFVDSSLGPRPLPQRVAMWLWEEDPKPLPLPLKNRLRTMRGVDFRRQYLPPSKSPEAQEPQVEEPLASTSKFVPQKPPRSKSFEPKRVNTYVLDIHDPPEGPKLKRPRMDLETPSSTTSNSSLLTAELNSSQYRSSVASSEPACGQLPMYVLESENMRVTYPDPLFSRKKGKDLPSLNANLEADLDSDSDSLIYFRSEMPKRVTMHLSINQTSSEDEAMEDGPAVQMNEELEFSEEQDKSQMSGSRSCDSPRLSPPPLKRILLADKKPNKE